MDERAVSLGEIWSLADIGVFEPIEVDFLEDFEFETACLTSVSHILVSTLNEPAGKWLTNLTPPILTARQSVELMVKKEKENFLNFPLIERMCDNPFTRMSTTYLGKIFSSCLTIIWTYTNSILNLSTETTVYIFWIFFDAI